MDDEATRMLEMPSVLLEGQSIESIPSATPCVGVSSMGQTHFDEAHVVNESSMDRHVSYSEGQLSDDRNDESSPATSRWRRALALGLGLLVGLGCAWIVLKQSAASPARRYSVMAVRVTIEDSTGNPLEGVPVSAGNSISISDEMGVALWDQLSLQKATSVTAQCPEGYVGTLARPLIQLRGIKTTWSLRLICDPLVVQSRLNFLVDGCSDALVFLAGERLGMTKDGQLSVVREHHHQHLLEVRLDPTDPQCELDGPRQLLLSRDALEQTIEWRGKKRVQARSLTRASKSRVPRRL